MKFKVLIVLIFLICKNSFAEPNNLETEDFFYIGAMKSYNKDFTFYYICFKHVVYDANQK